ncbi:MAG: PorT family protein [Bacteroidales bacterium]|nr:PorT family protein [Bacteroidales bacterium]
MKKLLFAIVALCAMLGSVDAGAQLVADAGFYSIHENENKNHTNKLRGVYLGAKYYYSLDHILTNLSLVPGVNVSIASGSNSMIYYGSKQTELALNIPVMANYTYRVNEMIKVFAQAGPTVQFGISNKASYSGSGSKTSYNCYQDNAITPPRRRLDIFLGFGAGVEVYDQYQLLIGYDLGLLQLSSNTDYMHLTRDLFHIGLGYRF